jgi:imidazolonepropionase-like amidohydrolase
MGGAWLVMGCLGIAALNGPAADAGEPAVVIHTGTLLAVPGQAAKSQQSIVIRDGRVTAILDGFVSAAQADVGADARVIDLSDRFVLPGLIDLHVHLTTEAEEGEALRVVTRDAAELALTASRHAIDTLNAGFTTVLDLGTSRAAHNEAIYALRNAISRGTAIGPRLLVTGSPIAATGASRTGHFAPGVEAIVGPEGTCDGADACRRVVQEQIAAGADAINLYNTGSIGDLKLTEQALTDSEMAAVVSAAHSLGRKVIADGHTARGINAALRAGADIIDTAPWPDEESYRLLRRGGVFLEPHMHAFKVAVGELRSGSTTVADQPDSPILARLRGVLALPFAAQRAFAEGVRLVYGSDTGIVRHGDNAGDFAEFAHIGLSPMQAIEVATVNAATAIGLRDEIGSIAVGHRADLIATAASPLADLAQLSRVNFVMREGHVYKMQ